MENGAAVPTLPFFLLDSKMDEIFSFILVFLG